MKLTLLEIVQDIMNDLDGDNVTHIDETIESQQVTQIIKTTYLEMMANRNWPHLKTIFSCTSTSNPSTPTKLLIPENIKEVEWIKYNKRTSSDTKDKYEDVTYKQPKDFQDLCDARNSSANNIYVMNESGLKLNIRKDKAPEYWTSFDDIYIVFDSWDSEVDDVIQTSKNNCYGVRIPSWTNQGNAIPDLPTEAFPALLEEAKSTAFVVLRETVNQKAEQKSARQQRWLSRKAWRAKGGVKYPNYGRKRNTGVYYKNPLLEKD